MEKIFVNTTFKSRIIRKPRQRWYKIVKIDDVPMPTALDVTKNLLARYAGETLTIVFLREGVEQTATLTTEVPKKAEP